VRLYHRGDRGEPVRDIQGRLFALGFDPAPDPRGIYGEHTEAAVRRFQTSRGLPADGIVGPETWRNLIEAGYRLGDRLLYRRVPMMRGDDVAELQRSLNALGFDCGKVDGIFGSATLQALLDFQQNRRMAEDGIAGREVALELRRMRRATAKPGREVVREREWLHTLPRSVTGARIYVDPACRDTAEAASTWEAALGLTEVLRVHGAHPLLSRSIDTSPPERLRARRANRLDVTLVVSLARAGGGSAAVWYFASEHSRSAAGEALAGAIAAHLGLPTAGRSTPILKDTRAPAVVVSVPDPDAATGRELGLLLVEIHRLGGEDLLQPKNRR